MVELNGQKFLTLTVKANETYKIKYGAPPTLSIANDTSGGLKIAGDEKFESKDGAGLYIDLPEGAAANETAFMFGDVYIKPSAAGAVRIARCQL